MAWMRRAMAAPHLVLGHAGLDLPERGLHRIDDAQGRDAYQLELTLALHPA